VDVAHQLQQIGVGLDQQGLEPASKEGTVPPILSIVALRVKAIEMSHRSGKIPLGCVKQQMIVVIHQAEGMNLNVPHAYHVTE
jgi:hypothetical protein